MAGGRRCFNKAMSDIFTDEEMAAGMDSAKAANSFNHKTFFAKVGLNSKSKEQLAKMFGILDLDKSGFIEVDELRRFLQNFKSGARDLNDREIKEFLKAGDTDGDGKIGVDEFRVLLET
uniref:parvalbumin beta-like n=1 Tax=Euleptes europaea TaxID=460621 RepID=UPI002541F6D8|nr:parvalbumin beta-like [Euleptes europaea]